MSQRALPTRAVVVSVLLVLLPVTLLGVWAGVSAVTGPWYRSETQLNVVDLPNTSNFVPLPPKNNQESRTLIASIDRQHELLMSDDVLRASIQWPSVRNTDWFKPFDGDVRLATAALRERISVHRVPDSSLLELSVTLPGRIDAQTVLDAWVTAYLQHRMISQYHNPLEQLFEMHLRERDRAADELKRLQEEYEAQATLVSSGDEAAAGDLARIDEDILAVTEQQKLAEAHLAELRLYQRRTSPTRVYRPAAPTEGERDWWYWP